MEIIKHLIDLIVSMYRYVFVEWRQLKITNKEICVDLGCGGRPLPRADIIVDKYIAGITERPTEFVDNGAVIVVCDLERLPFKNKSIDFSYSSHTIEHVLNIKKVLDEMSRISKRGFITCPSAMRESIMALKMHLWYISINKNILQIESKINPYPRYIGQFFDKLLASNKITTWTQFEKKLNNELFIYYYWKNKINYKILFHKKNNWKIEGNTEFKINKSILLSIRKNIIILSSKIIRYLNGPKNINIEKIICCPDCRSSLDFKNKFVICNACKIKFPHKEKRIFNFIKASKI